MQISRSIPVLALALHSLPALAQNTRIELNNPATKYSRAAGQDSDSAGFASALMGYSAIPASNEIRPIWGFPGASIFGHVWQVSDTASVVWIAPGQRYAVLRMMDGIALAMLNGDSATAPVSLPVAGNADSILFSPSGRAAAVRISGSSRVAVISELPDSPSVREIGDLEGTNLAVSDNGDLALFDGGSLRYLPGSGNGVRTIEYAEVGAAAFLPSTSSLAYVHRESRSLRLFKISDGSTSIVASDVDGFDDPGLQIAATAGGVMAIAPSLSRAVRIDLNSGAAQILDVPADSLQLTRLRMNGVFLLASPPGEPATLLVEEGGSARIARIPAAVAKEQLQ